MKRAILAAFALAITCGAVAVLRPPAPVAQPTAALLPSNPTVAVATTPERNGCHFTPGQRFAVSLDVRSGLELAATSRAPGRLVQTDALQATLQLEALTTADGHAVLIGRMNEPHATGRAFSGELNAPFLAELDAACALTRFARHQTTGLADARHQQAALWELAWRWEQNQTVSHGHNVRGAYEATSSGAVTSDGLTLQRHVDRYSSLWEIAGESRVKAFLTVQVNRAPWFDHLEAEETLETRSGTLRTRVRAEALEDTAARGDLDRDLSHYVWGDLLPMAISRREALPVTPHDRELQAQMREKSPAQAVAMTDLAMKQHPDLAATWPPLRAYLEARPEQTGAVLAELKQAHVSEDGLNPFFIAFGNARTTESRDAMLQVMRDGSAPPAIRARAMFTLVDRADVGADFARELQQTSQALSAQGTRSQAETYVGSEALLALSTMSGLHPDDEVRAIALDAIHAQLQPGATEHAQGTALRAIANLGDPALLPEVEPYTRSSSIKLRRAATHVTRRMAPQASDAFVIGWLEREPALVVKKDLFATLELQHLDAHARPSAALTRLLASELAKDEHAVIARKALLRLVGRSELAPQPEIRTLLKAQARRAIARRDGLANEALEALTPDEIREVAP